MCKNGLNRFYIQKETYIMKIFISACAALLLTFTLVISTSVTTKHIIDDMNREINASENLDSDNAISDNADYALRKADEIWNEHRFLLCLSISRKEADDIEISIKSTQAALESGNIGLYKVYLTALSEKLSKLAESETLSFEGIL